MKLILGEMSILLFSSKNLSAQKVLQNGFTFKFPKAKEALENLYK
jgi:NAD dependent epimerase/dehydratase family enzyme